jgi:4,5-dihydroxyphthalate decarboxylase
MIKLTFGLTREPRLEPLIDGTVRPQNIELDFVFCSPGEIHYRNLKYDEFDVFQMSISEFLMVKESGSNSKWQWSGLPVFLSKAFVWLNLFANAQAGVSSLGDLKGKRVGIPDYPMTAALWMRIFLKEFHRIKPGDIVWYNGRTKEFSHGAIFELDRKPPSGVSIQWLTNEQTLDVMLDKGELDIAYGFPPRQERDFAKIDRYGGTPIAGNEKIRKLFPDGGRKIITDYYKRTGVLPSNHMYVVQNSVLKKAPSVALELFKAFQRSKELAYQRARQSNAAYMLFEGRDFKEQAEVFGDDPYPLGIKQNQKMLEILFRGSYEDGLTKSVARIEDIFHPSTLDT